MRNLAPSTLAALPASTHRLADLEAAFNARHSQLRAIALTQPTMASDAGPRSQPRDGRGRFLPKAWLVEAECFTANDMRWFRQPLGC